MDHIEFFPYHNRLITFKERDSSEFKEGVVIDTAYSKKGKPTDYLFIKLENLSEWKKAKISNDSEAIERLQTIIDINNIVEVESELDKAVYKAVSSVISKISVPESLQHVLKIIKTTDGIYKIVSKNYEEPVVKKRDIPQQATQLITK